MDNVIISNKLILKQKLDKLQLDISDCLNKINDLGELTKSTINSVDDLDIITSNYTTGTGINQLSTLPVLDEFKDIPCVYMIQLNSIIKIGFSSKIVDRFKTFDSHTGFSCKLLGLRLGTRELEKTLHKRCLQYRYTELSDEWFIYHPEVIEIFKSESLKDSDIKLYYTKQEYYKIKPMSTEDAQRHVYEYGLYDKELDDFKEEQIAMKEKKNELAKQHNELLNEESNPEDLKIRLFI